MLEVNNKKEFVSGINRLYDALLSVLPSGEFLLGDVSALACQKINMLGPFETSPFEPNDISAMLGHLSVRALVSMRSDDRYSPTGRFEGNTIFYTATPQGFEKQQDLFSAA